MTGGPRRPAPAPAHKLYVCQTCRRDEARAPGTPTRGARLSAALAEALDAAGRGTSCLVRVACLNGCLHPCNVALRAPRKFGLRLSGLTDVDAPAVVAWLAEYAAHATGDLSESDWPPGLHAKLSARVPPPHLLLGG